MHRIRTPRQIFCTNHFWLLVGGALLCLLTSGCASFSDHMSAAPERSGAPPYADDPEANGNPAKAWYN